MNREKPWQPSRRYGLRGWRRWLMWWLFAPMLLAGLWMFGNADAGTHTAGGALVIVAVAVLGAWEWLLRRTVLQLSDTGLQLRQLGTALQTPWSNVVGFHAEPMRQGFVLDQPLEGPGARRLAFFSGTTVNGAPLAQGVQARLLAERRFIPVDAFAWHLRHGTLVAEVSALAPHLAMAMNTPFATDPGMAAARGQRLPLALIIGGLVALSTVLALAQPPWLEGAMNGLYRLAAPLVLLLAAASTWRMVRGRHWGMALLMLSWTLVTALWCAVAWQG